MGEMQTENYAISLLVNNKPGVLIRIALVFSRRGFNLESVVVSPSHDLAFSWMNLVARGEPASLDQILKQLNKLVDVIHARNHTTDDAIQREFGLVKVSCPSQHRGEILEIAQHFKAESVDLTSTTITFQIAGNTGKLDAFLTLLQKFGILESVRSGKLIMARGVEST